MRLLPLALLCAACSGPLTIAAAGDLQLSAERRDDPLAPLQELLVGDVRFVNLEGPLTNQPTKGVRGRPEQAEWLAHRVDVVSVANNHADDAGMKGRAETARVLRLAHVEPVADVLTLHRRGHMITIFARAYAPNITTDDALVAAVRRTHSLVIVSLHWGHTGSLLPTPEQRAFAAQLVDAGARLVLGHGPHTPQGIERRGDAIIAYSLGNLAFDCDCTKERDAYALRVTFDKRDRLQHVQVVPLRAGLREPPSLAHDAELSRLLRELSADLGTQLAADGTLTL